MKRTAFTLLEVLLALSIAVLLLSALYVAVNTQLRLSQAARDVVEHGTLARTLQGWISRDIRASLAPVPPDRSQSGSGSSSTSSSTSSSSSTTSTTGTQTGSTTPTMTGTSTSTSTSLTGSVQINYGVQGDAGRLSVYVSRIHRDPRFLPESFKTDEAAVSSDLRRITYWLVAGNGDGQMGLGRQVVRLVTAEDLMSSIPPDVPDETSYIIAEEVRSLRFSYFDGTEWRDSWDGTQMGPDGVSQVGPPLAIAVTLGITGGRGSGVSGDSGVKEYRFVVAIPTANGPTQQTTTGSP